MQILSPAFEDRGEVPTIYACEGDGINPPLDFSEVPDEAKSLALIMDDPDAPGGVYTHWLVWDLDPALAHLEEGNNSSFSLYPAMSPFRHPPLSF